VSEAWYKYALSYALISKMTPQAMKFAHGLIAAYPSSENWRDVLLTYRDVAKPDPSTELDAMRLMRLNKALAGERDFLSLADMLNKAGLPGETKSVLDEAVAANMVDAARPPAAQLRKTVSVKAAAETKALAAKEKAALAAANGTAALNAADAYFGRGDYAKSIPLYRAALQKGSVDANLANTHLGMALALAGQKAEAEAALKTVTGPRAGLSDFLLIWLAQRS
jgi:tetratricopeptide (TPR) repeat protein